MLSEPCPICAEVEGEAFAPAACGHCLCRSCAVRYVRAALGDARTSVFAEGLRCPQHPSGCSAHVTLADASKLLRDEPEACGGGGSLSADEPSLPEEHLLPKELDLLTKFTVEAAMPDCDKMFCPSCEQVLFRNGEAEQWVQCPHCDHSWNAATHAGVDTATDAFLRATSKPCPNCSMRTTHYHGHACHHIGYGTQGCPQCRQHWCYVCERKHGSPQGDGTPTAFTTMGNSKNPDCQHGSSFCRNQDILAHLRRQPYPHDDRCGCPICPNCRPGAPCEQCDGGCVVCQGTVEPGPSELAEERASQQAQLAVGYYTNSADFFGPGRKEYVHVTFQRGQWTSTKVVGDSNVPRGKVTFRTKGGEVIGQFADAEVQVRARTSDPNGYSFRPAQAMYDAGLMQWRVRSEFGQGVFVRVSETEALSYAQSHPDNV